MEKSPNPLALVVDDDMAVRDLVCTILEKAGYRTVAASDGDQVVDLALAHVPDVIVMDLKMERVDGYTTLTRLQGHAGTQAIPVIMLTGQSEHRYKALSAGVGAVAHMIKPFSRRQLVELVQRTVAGTAQHAS
jgi:two-component system, OmpR family, response regulator AdeR